MAFTQVAGSKLRTFGQVMIGLVFGEANLTGIFGRFD
jgi:hypothetical protein